MGQLNNLIDKFRKMNAKASMQVAFLKTQEDYVELNLSQMLRGLRSDGKIIGEYRWEVYAIEKNVLNPLPGFGVIDLRYTGAFYAGTFVSLKGNTIIIQSIDSKAPDIEKRFGTKFWGLTKENKQIFIYTFYKPALMKELGL